MPCLSWARCRRSSPRLRSRARDASPCSRRRARCGATIRMSSSRASRPAAASISSARRDSQLLPRLSFRGHTSPIMKSRRDRALLSRRRRRRDRCRGARLHALLASQGAFRETRTLARDLARPGSGHRASRRIAPCRSPAVARRFGAVRRQHRLHIGARPRARACCGAAPICARDGAPVSGRLLTLSTEERLRAGRAGRAGGPNGRLRF